MALLGKIEEFDPKKEDWRQYLERLEEFFVANDLTGESKAVKRRSTFISLIGPEPYKLLRSLLSPEKPKDKTFEELAAVLTKHYTPKPSEVVQSFRFFSRVRQPGETVADFVAELRRLAEDCNFDSALERMLRDRIVCGINDDAIQKKLLAEEKLTYKRAVELAQGTEAANKHHSEMKTPFKSEPVQTVIPRAAGQTEPTKVEEELDRLVAEGILEPIEYSDWAAPIVAVVKSDKSQ